MALIVDAGALYAQADRADPEHGPVVAVLRGERQALVTSQLAAAEADYLILTRLGVEVELGFLADLAESTFSAECLTRSELGEASDATPAVANGRMYLRTLSHLICLKGATAGDKPAAVGRSDD